VTWRTGVDTHRDSLARHVNDEVRRLFWVDADEAVPFFCECAAGCFHLVWLSLDGDDALTEGRDGLPLSAGHLASGFVSEQVPA